MRVLLDTHTFLWFISDDPRLSDLARMQIEDPSTAIEISPASYWEIAIKIGLGKYKLPQPYREFIESQLAMNRFGILPIEPKHTDRIIAMPLHHRDPFDRLLIAQSLVEDIPLLSADLRFDAYGVQRLW